MKITNFICIDSEGNQLKSDSFGNNAAVACPNCNHPILFVALQNQKGSAKTHKTKCNGCALDFHIEVDENKKVIKVKQ
jgi:transcription elongation factor Elf1